MGGFVVIDKISLKPGWIDVRKIDDYAERFAFAHHVTTKVGKTLLR